MKIYKNTSFPYKYVCSGWVTFPNNILGKKYIIGVGKNRRNAINAAFKVINNTSANKYL